LQIGRLLRCAKQSRRSKASIAEIEQRERDGGWPKMRADWADAVHVIADDRAPVRERCREAEAVADQSEREALERVGPRQGQAG
jgi:hypothetical protein